MAPGDSGVGGTRSGARACFDWTGAGFGASLMNGARAAASVPGISGFDCNPSIQMARHEFIGRG